MYLPEDLRLGNLRGAFVSPRSGLWPSICMLASAFLWGISWYPMRLLEQAGMSGLWLLFLLHGSPLVVTLPCTARSFGALRRRPGWVLLLTLGAAWSEIGFILAVLNGEVLRLMLLFYLSPLWATLLSAWLLRERLSQLALVSLTLSMLGAIFTLWDGHARAPWPKSGADWLAISAGLAFALSITAGRKLSTLPISAKLGGIWLSGAVVSGLAILIFQLPFPNVGLEVFLGAEALALGGVLFMTLLIQYGTAHLPVHRSSVLTLFELAVAAVASSLLTDESVTRWEWLGAALIGLGAYLSIRVAVNDTRIETAKARG